jgi:glycosyltransferase involved in cell wall biosynthesis
MTSQRPLVSILINNYNYGRFLREAIDSALQQTYTNTEVIVVDDGSTDDSRQIIASYGSRIIPVLKENGGQASAFNAGVAASRGEWICLLDSDDFFAPVKAQAIVDHARQFPEAALIVHALPCCDRDGVAMEFSRPRFTSVRLVDDRARARRGKLSVLLPATSGLALRRDLARQIFPMPEDINITADNYIKFASLGLGKVLLLPANFATQRVHGRNAYTHTSDSDASRIMQASLSIRIACRLRERFPFLRQLAWKQYGRAVQFLLSSNAPEAKQTFNHVRREYKLLEFTPACWFCIAGAFVRSWMGKSVRVREL